MGERGLKTTGSSARRNRFTKSPRVMVFAPSNFEYLKAEVQGRGLGTALRWLPKMKNPWRTLGRTCEA